MRKILVLALLPFLFGCNNEQEEIINTFNEFNKANIELNGDKLFELTDSESHNYYNDLLTKILKLDSVGVTKLSLSEKINVLSVRSIIEDEKLKKLSPKDLMIKIYTEINTMDSLQINAIKKTGITNIKIENKKAICDFVIDGKTLSPRVQLKFSKENGEWKFNAISMANFTERQLKTICEHNGFSQIDFITWIFNASNVGEKKIKALSDIWDPII